LFGSHARGDAHRHSDLDFLIIEPKVENVVKETYRLRCTLDDLDVFADIVLVTQREADEWGQVPSTVIHEALSEGRRLLAA
jgi:predicted nucleotidyltransferase